MAYQYVFGTVKQQGRERRVVRVKGPEAPELTDDVFYTAEEVSDDMYVSHEFRVGECFKRDEDAEGNHYAWYYVTEYSRTIDKSPGMKAEIERLTAEKDALEEELTNTQLALCDVYEMIGG